MEDKNQDGVPWRLNQDQNVFLGLGSRFEVCSTVTDVLRMASYHIPEVSSVNYLSPVQDSGSSRSCRRYSRSEQHTPHTIQVPIPRQPCRFVILLLLSLKHLDNSLPNKENMKCTSQGKCFMQYALGKMLHAICFTGYLCDHTPAHRLLRNMSL